MDEPITKPTDFASQFQRHHRSLWYVAMSVVSNTTDADDVLQEAAIIGLRKAGSFTAGSNFRAWMGEIVRNVALNRRKQSRRESSRLGQKVDVHQVETIGRIDNSTPVSQGGMLISMQQALDDRLLSALMELEPAPRACVLLRFLEGLEYTEIAQLLDIPKGTAMSHVFRSRRLLAQSLADSLFKAKQGER